MDRESVGALADVVWSAALRERFLTHKSVRMGLSWLCRTRQAAFEFFRSPADPLAFPRQEAAEMAFGTGSSPGCVRKR